MNIHYFVQKWPKYNQSSTFERILSMTQSLINLGHTVSLVCAQPATDQILEDIESMPVDTVIVNPNKIGSSLAGAYKKPDLALFSNYEMQKMYSIFLYNKWNKCPRVLQLSSFQGLQKWRKNQYNFNLSSFIHEYGCISTDLDQIITKEQKQSINRCDYYFCNTEFIAFNLKNRLGFKNYSVTNAGLPMRQFLTQIQNLRFRDFEHRNHFIFLGSFYNQKNINIIQDLIENIWPLIKRQIKDAELHIYGYGYHKEYSGKKAWQKMGIYIKGFMKQLNQIQKYRVMLCPFKIKVGNINRITQSWFNHTPVVTTPVGAEGLFLQTTEPMFSATNNGQVFEGFFKQRQLSREQLEQKSNLQNYYKSNKFDKTIERFNFGGFCNSFSYQQFAKNAINLYNNKQIWKNCLKLGRKSLLKNHSENQFQINLKYALSQVQLSMYQNRHKKQYKQQWDRYLKSKQIYHKLHQKGHYQKQKK